MTKKPYVIIAPDWAHMCAGITSLHKLCHELNSKGYEAYTTGYPPPPGHPDIYNCRTTHGLSREESKRLQRDGVAVYPDIVPGNPLCFSHVVRWWLGISIYEAPNELTFSMSRNQSNGVPIKYNLGLLQIESTFRPPEVENRDIVSFFVHKGRGIPRIPETNGAIEITQNWPPNRRELTALLQRSKILYSYDDCSLLTVEARLCGCPVKIVGYTNLDEKKVRESPFTAYGMALPGEEVDLPKLYAELPQFYEVYRNKQEESRQEVEQFIELTQAMNFEYIHNPCEGQAPQTWLPLAQFGGRD